MKSELRKLITQLDRWLGKVYGITLDIQKNMMKSKFKLEPELKKVVTVPLDSLVNRVAQFRTKIDNQKQALSIMQRTPPGFLVSVLDFVYNVAVNPNAPSQKQMYFDKLNKIDQNINKDYVSATSALGIPEFRMEQGIRKGIEDTITKWQNVNINMPRLSPQSLENREDLIKKLEVAIDPTIKNMFSPDLVNEGIAELKKVLFQSLEDPRQLGDALGQFINQLEVSISEQITPQKKKSLQSGFAQIRKAIQKAFVQSASSQAIHKMAADQSLVQTIQNYRNALQELGNGQEFVEQAESIVGQMGDKASKEDVDFAQKYLSFVKALIYDSRDSVQSHLMSLDKNLQSLQQLLEEETPEQPQQTAQSLQQPSEQQ